MSATLPFTQYKLGELILKNRMVMAPMTRCRATDNLPNELMAEYYAQRAGVGLIITEAVAISPNALGYARMPGIYTPEQVAGWKLVTQAVHRKGGKIFAQLVHCGRVAQPLNMPAGSKIVAPSAIPLQGEMWTDVAGRQPYGKPQALSEQELALTVQEFVQAAENAIAAGFDGVELHAANGYLLEQFIAPCTNQRTDAYGGTVKNRCRLVLETAKAVSERIGTHKTGIRLSPFGVTNGMELYEEAAETYQYLAGELQKLNLVYLHLVDHSSTGAPEVPLAVKKAIRQQFRNTLILSGGYDIEKTEQDISSGLANLVAFGRPFISNPDLPERLQNQWPLTQVKDPSTYYSAGAHGYTDYPVYQPRAVMA